MDNVGVLTLSLLTNLFINYEMGQEFTKIPSNHILWDSASVPEECGSIWLLSN